MYGYYPFLYPSVFVSGMVGLDTLELRRKMLLLTHYYLLLHNKVDNPSALERMILRVPGRREAIASRCAPRLFAWPAARSRYARNAPTARASILLGDMLAQHEDVDIFASRYKSFIDSVYIFINSI